jgi:hypothetical protein
MAQASQSTVKTDNTDFIEVSGKETHPLQGWEELPPAGSSRAEVLPMVEIINTLAMHLWPDTIGAREQTA